MTRSLSVTLGVSLGLTLGASSGLAHHSFTAEFDIDTPVRLEGKVTEMKWANPHAWIYLDVEDEAGNVVNWALETRAANGLIRRGWRPGDLVAGTVLSVNGYQARNGTPTASIGNATFADGRTLFEGSPEPEEPQN